MKKRSAISVWALAAAVALAGCGGNSSSSSSTDTSTEGASGARSSGTITIAGSTALLPLVKRAAEQYQTAHSDVKISVSGGGSRVGITQAAQRGVEIGDSDIPAEGQPSLVDHRVAVVTFAVVTNQQNGVKNLSTAQIRKLFSGSVKNWKDVGGANQAVTIINRPRSSGTRAVFVKTLMGGAQPTESGLTQDASGTVASMVAQTPGAVSYLALSYVKGAAMAPVSIDGVAPSAQNVVSGKYPFWSYEHMLTYGQPSPHVAAFIDFVTKDREALDQFGFIPIERVHAK